MSSPCNNFFFLYLDLCQVSSCEFVFSLPLSLFLFFFLRFFCWSSNLITPNGCGFVYTNLQPFQIWRSFCLFVFLFYRFFIFYLLSHVHCHLLLNILYLRFCFCLLFCMCQLLKCAHLKIFYALNPIANICYIISGNVAPVIYLCFMLKTNIIPDSTFIILLFFWRICIVICLFPFLSPSSEIF